MGISTIGTLTITSSPIEDLQLIHRHIDFPPDVKKLTGFWAIQHRNV